MIIILFTNCGNKRKIDDCTDMSSFLINNFEKGNNIFIVPDNTQYLDYEYYYAFKKYDVVNYLYFYPESVDSCNMLNIKKQLIKKNIPIDKVVKDLDSIVNIKGEKHKEHSAKILSYKKAFLRRYNDNVFEFNGAFLTRPTLKNMLFTDFEKHLTSKILEIDSTFIQSSFWIVVDSTGSVSEIEKYVKHSDKVDSLIIENLIKSKWNPSILKEKNTPENVRLVFTVNKN